MRIKSVKKLKNREDVYDITVPKYHNFLLSSGIYVHNCAGWSLRDLLLEGFNLKGFCSSSPAKHFDTALSQVINFIGTLQNEFAGAQAFNNVDTYLAPFIRYDGLDYEQVVQLLQRFIFNLNTTSRWGGQCVDMGTECLTPEGWKTQDQLEVGEEIYTFNMGDNTIERKPLKRVSKYPFKGDMVRIKGRKLDQLVTPNHKCVRETFGKNRQWVFTEAEDLMDFKTSVNFPNSAFFVDREGFGWSDDEIRLLGWALSDSHMEKKRNRLCIYQSETKFHHDVRNLLDRLNLKYSENRRVRDHCQPCFEWKVYGDLIDRIRDLTNLNRNSIPREFLQTCNQHEAEVFLSSIALADAFSQDLGYFKEKENVLILLGEHKRVRFVRDNSEFYSDLQELLLIAGYGSGVSYEGSDRTCLTSVWKQNKSGASSFEYEDYEGEVWCPTTDNGTFIMRRNGKVSITGNTPFSNLTLDLVCPKHIGVQPVIRGGELQESLYEDFQPEMDIFNKAFLEVMMEGDTHGRVFTFPIPTYNVTKDFPWETEIGDRLADMTAKYGIPYFQNFINSDINPEDVQSMCCLESISDLLIRKKGKINFVKLGQFVDSFTDSVADISKEDIEVFSFNQESKLTEWDKVIGVLKKHGTCKYIITQKDGKVVGYDPDHIHLVFREGKFQQIKSRNLCLEDRFSIVRQSTVDPFNQEYQKVGPFTLDEGLAEILGHLYANGDYLWYPGEVGNPDKLKGIQISVNSRNKEWIGDIKRIFKLIFEVDLKEKQDPRYVGSLYLYLHRSEVAKEFYKAGFTKESKIPELILNSPKEVLRKFVNTYFKYDGYVRNNSERIHMNDYEFSRQLTYINGLLGEPNSFRTTKEGQKLRKSVKNVAFPSKGSQYDTVPISLLPKVDNRLISYNGDFVSKETIKRKNLLETEAAKVFLTKDFALIKIEKIEIVETDEYFYDLETERNHIFVHSFGNITHNCRLRINKKEVIKKTGGLFGAGDLTGSIGVVTINLPCLAYIAKDESEFQELVDHYMELAKNSLELKRKIVNDHFDHGMYPWAKRYLKKGFDGHFSTIGLIGGHEACLNLIGKDLLSKEGASLMVRTLERMAKNVQRYQEETGILYNLEATPAEGTSFRLAKIDKKRFPDIIQSGDQVPYYTNSTQFHPSSNLGPINTIIEQEKFQVLYTGGTVIHTYLGESVSNGEAVKNFITKAFTQTKIPYLSITPTFSICEDHGYLKGEHYTCPQCDKETECYSRVVGYLRDISKRWNPSKKEEWNDRVKFTLDSN